MTTTTFCSAFIRVLHHFEAKRVRGLYLAQQPGQATQPGQAEQAGTSSLAPVAQSQNVRCEPARHYCFSAVAYSAASRAGGA